MHATSAPAHEAVRQLLRHTLATLAYRCGKCLRGAPESFGEFSIAPGTRKPAEILAHIGDLLDWALSIAKDEEVWRDSRPLPWATEVDRFFEKLSALDHYLASDRPLACAPENFFQGPVADAFTHVGQIAMLRRLAGAPIKGENYFQAKIATGKVGSEQPPAIKEFR
jgi:hypothetical protein